MSLILDALKKSEEKRQLGQAPTLGSSILATRPRRNLLPYIVAAILLVALIGLWQFNKYKHSHRSKALVVAGAPAAPAPATTSPARNNRAPVANPAGVAAVTPATAPAVPSAPPPVTSAVPPPSMVFGGKKPAAAASAPAVAPKVAAPVTGPIPTPAPAVATAPATAPAIAPPAAKAIPPPPAFGAAPAPTTASPTTASAATAAPIAPSPAVSPDNTRAPAPATAANPDAKPVQAYYELPFPVRKDLPAIKISMHVYAVDPAQRFIVVNNVHQGEGDSIEGGVTVREIRPTDIVLEFQGKIFSVPRTGI